MTATQAPLRRTGTIPRPIAPGLAYMRDRIVNLFFAGVPDGRDGSWVLVDAGLAGSAGRIAAAAEAFAGDTRPAAIILTHGHFDHVGALETLAERWDVPVYAHRLELPHLTGRSSYPPPDPTVGGGAMSSLSRLYPRGPIDLGHRARALPEDGSVPGMPGWRWIHTPGHTAGHVSFFRDEDRVLIAGDAFITTKQESLFAVLEQRLDIHGPPAYYTPDWGEARRSLQVLAGLEPELAATGHGMPMRGEHLRGGLRTLARFFDRVAVPEAGRYVLTPALTDESGVQYVPPPRPDPLLNLLTGVGLFFVLRALILSNGSR